MTSLEKAQEGLRLAETATPGPFKFEEDQEGSSMGWIMKHNEALFDVRGDSAQQALNAEYFAHCGTHHADICRAYLELAEAHGTLTAASKEACGKLAEYVAIDMDHRQKDHSRWYKAVQRVRELLDFKP